MKTTYKPIENIAELTARLQDGEGHDFFINLGGIRSSKGIRLIKTKKGIAYHFVILNEIDGTIQTLTLKQLYIQSNIGQAIDAGNFYAY